MSAMLMVAVPWVEPFKVAPFRVNPWLAFKIPTAEPDVDETLQVPAVKVAKPLQTKVPTAPFVA